MPRPDARTSDDQFLAIATTPRPGSQSLGGEVVISLNDAERKFILEALAGFYARSGTPREVTASMRMAQRLEGFDINGFHSPDHGLAIDDLIERGQTAAREAWPHWEDPHRPEAVKAHYDNLDEVGEAVVRASYEPSLALLASECDRYGLRQHSLAALLRHLHGNWALTHTADLFTIDLLTEKLREAGIRPDETPRYVVAERIVGAIWEHALAGGSADGDYATSVLAEHGLLDDAQRIVSERMDQADAFDKAQELITEAHDLATDALQ